VTFENILVEREKGYGIITLNRPEVLNALSLDLCRELDSAVTELEKDTQIGAIIITGKGAKAFSAGADVHETMRDGTPRQPPPSAEEQQFAWHVANCSKPTIGAVNGLAYGSGASLAVSLDIRVGCEDSSFRFLAASHGKVSATWNLPLQVGWPIAKELLLTARVVDAREAYRIGLLNHLVACDQMMLKAIELATYIAANDRDTVQRILGLLAKGIGAGWRQMYDNEIRAE